MRQSFNELVRYWRARRGFSQLELAERAGLSSRHVSFLETGRSSPSRDAVLAIGRALGLPDLEQRRLLIQAGFAADWTPRFADPDTADRYLKRLQPMLVAMDPMPAFITSPSLRAISFNRAAAAFFRHCLDPNPDPDSGLAGTPFDIRNLISDSSRFRRLVSNWAGLAERIRIAVFLQEPDPDQLQPLADLRSAIRDSTSGSGPPAPDGDDPSTEATSIVPVEIRDQGFEFTLELLALPLTAGWIGYTQLVCLSNEGLATGAREYFSRLIARFDAA